MRSRGASGLVSRWPRVAWRCFKSCSRTGRARSTGPGKRERSAAYFVPRRWPWSLRPSGNDMTGPHRRSLHEAAHKADTDTREPGRPGPGNGNPKRSFNEAAHKLGYWRPPTPPAVSAHEQESEAVRRRFEALADSQRDVIAHAGRTALVLGALGVVYGDIGTSPLYTEQVIFSSYRATAHITPAAVYGVASLIFWALTIVVSIKYAGVIMRAHNRGDGGIMALTALLQRNHVGRGALLVTLGIFGAGVVLRRRHDHARHLGPRVDPGGAGGHSGAVSPRGTAVGRDPARLVRCFSGSVPEPSGGCSAR